MNSTHIGTLRWLCSKLTYANLLSTAAVALSLIGTAYASLVVLSTDIVDGEVKAVDIASNAVTTAKLASGAVTAGKLANNAVTNAKIATNAVTGAKVLDNSLTGADIDETTLSGVNADSLRGRSLNDLTVSFDSTSSSQVLTLPACNPGLAYITTSFSGTTNAGEILLIGSVTAGTGTNFSAPFGIAARLERVTPTPIIGDWQESHFGSGGAGRSNITVTQKFPIAPEGGTFVLRVCDASDSAGGQTIRGQLSYIYRRPF
jgi:hypothetical protein